MDMVDSSVFASENAIDSNEFGGKDTKGDPLVLKRNQTGGFRDIFEGSLSIISLHFSDSSE